MGPALGFGNAPMSNQDLARQVLAVKEVLARLKLKDKRAPGKTPPWGVVFERREQFEQQPQRQPVRAGVG